MFYVIFVQVQQHTIQHRMKQKLEEQVLHTITSDEIDIHWVKPGKEILVNGRMFDVKFYHTENGHCIVTGLYDDDETTLVEQLQKSQQENNTSGNKLLVVLFQLLQTACDNPQEENFLAAIKAGFQFPVDTSPLPFHFISILTPPPQV